jgi:site-specific recombinase XerD
MPTVSPFSIPSVLPHPPLSVPTSSLDEIAERLDAFAEAARGAYAGNTTRAYRADTAIFSAWCQANDRSALPAAAETVGAFIDAMAEIRKPATVRRYVSSVSKLHRAAALRNPAEGDVVRLALRRMHRSKGRRQDQALGLTAPLRGRLLDAMGTRLIELRNRALLSTAYDTALRRSELVALRTEDLSHETDGSGTVLVRQSKTDAEGTGRIVYLAPDTMRMIDAWMTATNLTGGLLFRSVGKGGNRVGHSLDDGSVARVFKTMATTAGVRTETAARLSGHSTRIGLAQDLAADRIELPAIMQAGGWKTAAMVARYTERLAVRRSAAARLAESQGRV